MEKFIPFEKLSKKKQRELNSLRRTVWAVSPATRRPEDPKAYKRTKTQNRRYDDSDSASLYFSCSQYQHVADGDTADLSFALSYFGDAA